MAARSKACVSPHSVAGIVGSNPAEGMDVSLFGNICCQVEVPASGELLVPRSSTECGVSECDGKASIMRRLWPIRGCCTMGGGEDEGNCVMNDNPFCCRQHK